jgi:hypothetical protein
VVRSDTRSRFDTKKPPFRGSLTFHFNHSDDEYRKNAGGLIINARTVAGPDHLVALRPSVRTSDACR